MKTSENGIAVMHYFEYCKLEAYPDPATGGAPWTIGWGHTGPEVKPGLKWDQKKADQVFVDDLNRFESAIGPRLLNSIPTQGQFDALVCFAYNCGVANLKSSTLLRLLNAGDISGAQAQFARWNKAAGKVMRGLTRRRAAEAALFAGRSGAEAIAIGVKAA